MFWAKDLKYSQNGLALTEQFEGVRLESYQDSGGVWTIGYGHTRSVGPNMTCTLQQAQQWLLEDIAIAQANVQQHVVVQITQGMFDALVDFAFNCGCKNLDSSTLLRLVNSNDFTHAVGEFEKWSHVGGKVVAGLLRRRQAEEAEFKAA